MEAAVGVSGFAAGAYSLLQQHCGVVLSFAVGALWRLGPTDVPLSQLGGLAIGKQGAAPVVVTGVLV
eukprot:CAMPEP_0202884478 /NCGR_PEP_ID=MMETSP1391-20130828/41024_1 /ASSEMBLY_ACC=CAM_ASM_000867 /TAXON_ID=1034604 /ORGANISM="Chlamydomonas leiostraca, Strain SAG 11-49" /LENGTH=66 /DNA_ID=CAMNT_0049567679 /DNA_START=476 /DNA_END=676 /DNA_ORIENTATION=-